MIGSSQKDLLNQTLELAKSGADSVAPNPMVGAVIVRGGAIVGTGFHACYGGPHAEAEALSEAGTMAGGATLYCNLEPCSFDAPGKHQPPCTRNIIRARIAHVIIGQLDPNPRVRGNGVRLLREGGIKVTIANDDARFWHFNSVFNTVMALGRPHVHIKAATSLDGRIAAATGASKWITDAPARGDAHLLRRRHDAVAVGIGTILTDDPRLTYRLGETAGQARPQPRAVVFDSRLRMPLSARLVRERAPEMVIVTLESEAPGWKERYVALTERGVTVAALRAQPQSKRAPIQEALKALHRLGIRSLLVEGGAALITSFISTGLFDRFTAYIAPILMGQGIPLLGCLGVKSPREALPFANISWRRIGDQQVFEGTRADWLDEVRNVVRIKTEEG